MVGLAGRRCYNPSHCMADWKQITARIRRARGSKDPAGQLANLFEKTHDAMVAFELAKHFETAGQTPDSLKWYATAAERFRRADWKTKAHEAIVRLGGTIPEPSPTAGATSADSEIPSSVLVPPADSDLTPANNAAALESAMAVSSEFQAATETPSANSEANSLRGRRRRGRRGGRNRRRGEPQAASDSATSAAPSQAARISADSSLPSEHARHRELPSPPADAGLEREPGLRGRFGDPGLSSRLTLLEMQLRRLLTCPPSRLDQADKAPVGPGVFVLTDEDLTSYYYVEACDTLRIAIGHVTRGTGGRRGNPTLKPQLADHLGIPEARVGKYLTDHCVVRWLQLDEGATYFSHYAIAVLRPILNE